MQRFTLTILAVALLMGGLNSSARASEDQRKGMVFGFGAGYAPTIKATVDASVPTGGTESSFLGSLQDSQAGVGLQAMIGLGLDEQNMVVFESNMGWFKYLNVPVDVNSVVDVDIVQGTNTLSWYHYYGETGKSFFTMVGGGFGYFDTNYSNANTPGFGYLVGAGYEFAPHLQFGAYVSSFKTSNSDFAPLKLDGTHTNVSILLTSVLY